MVCFIIFFLCFWDESYISYPINTYNNFSHLYGRELKCYIVTVCMFFNLFLLLFKYSHLNFPPLCPSPFPSPPPPLHLLPLVLSMCPLYMLLDSPSPIFPIIPFPTPLWLLSVCSLLNVSGYILFACLFCWLGSTYRWDPMVFVFHCLAYFT